MRKLSFFPGKFHLLLSLAFPYAGIMVFTYLAPEVLEGWQKKNKANWINTKTFFYLVSQLFIKKSVSRQNSGRLVQINHVGGTMHAQPSSGLYSLVHWFMHLQNVRVAIMFLLAPSHIITLIMSSIFVFSVINWAIQAFRDILVCSNSTGKLIAPIKHRMKSFLSNWYNTVPQKRQFNQ